MVDTINPQTGREEGNSEFQQQNPPTNPAFYTGFSRPEDVHVNLVGSTEPTQNSSSVSATPQMPVEEKPAPNVHFAEKSYSAADKSELKKTLLFSGVGVLVVVLVSVITYFATLNVYGTKLKNESAELATAKTELESLMVTPAPLQVEEEIEVPESNAPIVDPEPEEVPPVVEEEEPIVEPTPTLPSTDNSGQG